MKDFCLSKDTLNQFWQLCMDLAQEGKRYRVSIVEWRDKRTLTQNALQHSIYNTVSEYLIAKGRTDWIPKVAKYNLKHKFLGWHDVKFTDIITGEVTFKEELVSSSGLDKGDAHFYTTQIIEWAEGIGCEIRIPEKCDYRKIQMEQEK